MCSTVLLSMKYCSNQGNKSNYVDLPHCFVLFLSTFPTGSVTKYYNLLVFYLTIPRFNVSTYDIDICKFNTTYLYFEQILKFQFTIHFRERSFIIYYLFFLKLYILLLIICRPSEKVYDFHVCRNSIICL